MATPNRTQSPFIPFAPLHLQPKSDSRVRASRSTNGARSSIRTPKFQLPVSQPNVVIEVKPTSVSTKHLRHRTLLNQSKYQKCAPTPNPSSPARTHTSTSSTDVSSPVSSACPVPPPPAASEKFTPIPALAVLVSEQRGIRIGTCGTTGVCPDDLRRWKCCYCKTEWEGGGGGGDWCNALITWIEEDERGKLVRQRRCGHGRCISCDSRGRVLGGPGGE